MKLKRILITLLVLLMTGTTAAPPVAGTEPRISRPGEYAGYSPGLYEEWVRTSQYLPARDGTRLAVDLYRPAVDGKPVQRPFPVVWEHQTSTCCRCPPSSRPDTGCGSR
ncbi:hypothetical protein [Streptomyces tendae]|uniref:hypothetical protein n=1 Tax=Streptomyces tendae TaxID=1932 RepID=UPI00365AAE0A